MELCLKCILIANGDLELYWSLFEGQQEALLHSTSAVVQSSASCSHQTSVACLMYVHIYIRLHLFMSLFVPFNVTRS